MSKPHGRRAKPLATRPALTVPTTTNRPAPSAVQRVLADRQRRLGITQQTTTATTITSPPPPTATPSITLPSSSGPPPVTKRPSTPSVGQPPPSTTTTTTSTVTTTPPILLSRPLARLDAPPADKLDSLDDFLRQPPGMKPWELGELQDVVQRGRAAQQRGVLTPELAADLDAALALAELIQIGGDSSLGAPPILHRGLILDGVPVDRLPRQMVGDIGNMTRGHGGKVEAVLQYLAADGPYIMTTQELADTISTVGDLFDRILGGEDVDDDSEHAEMARNMARDALAADELGATLDTRSSQQVPGRQARAINEFLARNPRYIQNLRQQFNVSFLFGSDKARPYGGGLFLDGTVHIDKLDGVSPDMFMRTWLHETGHAGFQRALLPQGKLPTPWEQATMPALLRRRRLLHQTLQQALGPPAPPPQQRPRIGNAPAQPPQPRPEILELADIERQLDSPEGLAVWNAMPPDTQDFYQAWLVLRENNGEHLLGLALTGHTSEGRRGYQAGAFSEFCAENFMLSATGRLGEHLNKIMADNTIDQKVKDAWIQTVQILDKHGKPILKD